MHRIDTSTAQVDKFGSGKNGFTGGNPQTGQLPTALDADYFDSIQEELSAVIEAAGITLNKGNNAQLLAAMNSLYTNGRLIGARVITTSGTYIPTAGTKTIIAEVVGGGGSGGGAGYTFNAGYITIGGPGGAGGYIKHLIASVAASYAVTIGSGGAARSGDYAGNAGGATYFGTDLIAHGGWGGATSGNINTLSTLWYTTAPAVTTNTGGNIASVSGDLGQPGFVLATNTSGFNAISGSGGSSPFGRGGQGRLAAQASVDALGYGSGGGGALHWAATTNSVAVASGKGTNGIVIVWEYA